MIKILYSISITVNVNDPRLLSLYFTNTWNNNNNLKKKEEKTLNDEFSKTLLKLRRFITNFTSN